MARMTEVWRSARDAKKADMVWRKLVAVRSGAVVVVVSASVGQRLGWPGSLSRPISKDSLMSGVVVRRAATSVLVGNWETFSRPGAE